MRLSSFSGCLPVRSSSCDEWFSMQIEPKFQASILSREVGGWVMKLKIKVISVEAEARLQAWALLSLAKIRRSKSNSNKNLMKPMYFLLCSKQ